MSAVTLSHYIAGEWVSSDGGEWTSDVNPSDATQELARIPQGGQEVVNQAAEAAVSAYREWRRYAGPGRAEILHRAANLLAESQHDLASVAAAEVGKPIGEAEQEVQRGVDILRYFAEEAVHPMGMVIPAQRAASLQFSLRQPVGPVAVISPWNFPIAIPLWKIAPALAYGNTVVWKPAEVASLTASRLVEVFSEVGLPAGVLNLVLGKGAAVGDALVSHDGIRAVTFTGSNPVGLKIGQTATRRNIKFQLEMGGKNAAIVLPDADLDQAAQLVAAGAMRYAGQKCTATSRAIVSGEVAHEFVRRLTDQIEALPVAPATEASSAVGPLITAESVDRLHQYSAKEAHRGQIVLGGDAPTGDSYRNGYFFQPTVIVDVPVDAPAAQEEIFGPLLVVHEAASVAEAISIANGTPYGLSVSLFTRDINSALEYIHEIDCGMVRVNGDTTGVDPHAPFGGMRESSSHSREQGPAAIEFFTETKTVQINPAGGR